MTDRRAAVLDAALDAFTERGYSATTIAEVRRRSGASVGSIYHRFKDKEGIATALYVECLRDYQRGLLEELGREKRAERGIRAMVRHHLRWLEANPRRAAFLLGSSESDVARAAEGEVRELNRHALDGVREWLRPHVEAGAVRRMPLQLLYVIVLGPCQEYARHWLRDPARSPIGRAERVLADAAWNAVRAEPEGD
jgi:AcrR family transcriptional regulator